MKLWDWLDEITVHKSPSSNFQMKIGKVGILIWFIDLFLWGKKILK